MKKLNQLKKEYLSWVKGDTGPQGLPGCMGPRGLDGEVKYFLVFLISFGISLIHVLLLYAYLMYSDKF